jgi:hypothetical protein
LHQQSGKMIQNGVKAKRVFVMVGVYAATLGV